MLGYGQRSLYITDDPNFGDWNCFGRLLGTLLSPAWTQLEVTANWTSRDKAAGEKRALSCWRAGRGAMWGEMKGNSQA